MASFETCPKCGEQVPPSTSAAQCPHCLLAMAALAMPANESLNGAPDKFRRRIGDYVLGRQLGGGGMGVVYEAHQVSLNRKVALKFIRDSLVATPTILRRFTIEAEATARLHHPNIVRIHEIGEVDGQPFFSMELISGDSLKGEISKGAFVIGKEGGCKSKARATQVAIARLMATTARAVHHAHQRGVLHRDLKPANILLDQDGEPHLTDFGLAKILRESPDHGTRTSPTIPGSIGGTPSYMAPEQIGGGAASASADIYGLGAILYELLTGRPPFLGDTPVETLRRVQEQAPIPPRRLNPIVDKDLDTICMKCLEKDSHHRYGSAEAVAQDLENWIEHRPIRARPASTVRRSVQWMQRNRVGTALIATFVIGFLASLAVLQVVKRQRDQNDEQRAALLKMIMDRLTDDWSTTNVHRVTIESENLALLAGQFPIYDPGAPKLKFGITHVGDPRSYAQDRARFLHTLEKKLSLVLKRRILLDLLLFKPGLNEAELLAKGEADLLFVSPVSFFKAREINSRISLIARERNESHAVIVASSVSETRDLKGLAGHAFAFPHRDDVITVCAQALLVQQGVFQSDLRRLHYFDALYKKEDHAFSFDKIPRREALSKIHNREFTAAATTRRRYELEKHRGLRELAAFTVPAGIFASREGLDKTYIDALRNALINTPASARARSVPIEDANDWQEPFSGAVEISEEYLQEFENILRKAREFDSSTPTDANPQGASDSSPSGN